VYLKTTIIKPNIKITINAGVPSSQALPGFPGLITAPPSVCVSALLGALAVWIQKTKMCSTLCVPAVLGALAVWRQNNKKIKKGVSVSSGVELAYSAIIGMQWALLLQSLQPASEIFKRTQLWRFSPQIYVCFDLVVY